jgi:hypothetical protein
MSPGGIRWVTSMMSACGAIPVAGGHETVLEPVVGEEAQVAKTVHDP